MVFSGWPGSSLSFVDITDEYAEEWIEVGGRPSYSFSPEAHDRYAEERLKKVPVLVFLRCMRNIMTTRTASATAPMETPRMMLVDRSLSLAGLSFMTGVEVEARESGATDEAGESTLDWSRMTTLSASDVRATMLVLAIVEEDANIRASASPFDGGRMLVVVCRLVTVVGDDLKLGSSVFVVDVTGPVVLAAVVSLLECDSCVAELRGIM